MFYQKNRKAIIVHWLCSSFLTSHHKTTNTKSDSDSYYTYIFDNKSSGENPWQFPPEMNSPGREQNVLTAYNPYNYYIFDVIFQASSCSNFRRSSSFCSNMISRGRPPTIGRTPHPKTPVNRMKLHVG